MGVWSIFTKCFAMLIQGLSKLSSEQTILLRRKKGRGGCHHHHDKRKLCKRIEYECAAAIRI